MIIFYGMIQVLLIIYQTIVATLAYGVYRRPSEAKAPKSLDLLWSLSEVI